MAALARWCFQRRTWVLVAWLALVIILGVGGRAAGTAYSNNVTLPGTGSTTALTLLEKAFPGTPKAMTAKVVPDKLTETGLKDALSAALNPWYWLAFTAANSADADHQHQGNQQCPHSRAHGPELRPLRTQNPYLGYLQLGHPGGRC